MVKNGIISQEDAMSAFKEKIIIKKKINYNLKVAPYFLDYIKYYMVKKYGEENLLTKGYRIYTSVDLKLQDYARKALRKGLEAIREYIDNLFISEGKDVIKLRPIHCNDITCMASDFVLSGGSRRSATIHIFSKDDDEMIKAKQGTWWIDHPYRSRSNNSAVLVRDKTSKEEFWDRVRGDEISEIDKDIACEVFDMAVNMGVKAAIRNLQKAINITYGEWVDAKAKDFITVDGIVGKETLSALEIIKDYDGMYALAECFRKLRALKYAQIVKNNPNQAVFIYGWLKRALKVG